MLNANNACSVVLMPSNLKFVPHDLARVSPDFQNVI